MPEISVLIVFREEDLKITRTQILCPHKQYNCSSCSLDPLCTEIDGFLQKLRKNEGKEFVNGGLSHEKRVY